MASSLAVSSTQLFRGAFSVLSLNPGSSRKETCLADCWDVEANKESNVGETKKGRHDIRSVEYPNGI